MTRSRLRRPTSKSTTTTRSPVCANAAPSAAVVVVLPTPPLPDVTTSTFAILVPLSFSIQRRSQDRFALEPHLRPPPDDRGLQVVGGPVEAVDRQELGLEPAAEDARPRVAHGARDGAAAQDAVDVDRAAGDHLGAGADRSDHGQVALREHDRLAGPDRALDDQRRRRLA